MYRIALIADNHFVYDQEGRYYISGTYTKQYLERFTRNFDEVVIIGRGHSAISEEETEKLSETGGDKVFFEILPDFHGIKKYILLRNSLKKRIKEVLEGVDAVFVRMPCILTTISISIAKKANMPIMVDVGADPGKTYLSSKPSLSEKLISKYLSNVCRTTCAGANGVSYVTEKALQREYPCKAIVEGESPLYFSVSLSNVDISDAFYYSHRQYVKKQVWSFIHVSNSICKSSGKGHIECLRVIADLVRRGCDASITFVGGGNGQNELLEIAHDLGIEERLSFTGRVDRAYIRSLYLSHDIFLFPSYTEGLPRVIIEAMSTGLICIASNVGGIPELLEERDIFEYDDITGMSERIIHLISNDKEMNEVSSNNYNKSLMYSNTNLRSICDNYHDKVKLCIDEYRKSNDY